MTPLIARILSCGFVLAATLLSACPAAAQMHDSEMAAPRTWTVVLAPPLTDNGVALLQEVSVAVGLLPEQVASTRRVQVAGPGGEAAPAAHREIAVALTAAQLGQLRQWQAAHPQQAALLGLPAMGQL